MQNNLAAHYTIGFNADERSELLEIFKNNPKWKNRVESGGGFLVNNLSNFVQEFQGCADSGFCFTCKIIVGDPTCFCAGGKCPKCGNHVSSRNIPKDLNGIYEKHSRGLGVVKQRYENGEWKETINNPSQKESGL